VLTGLHQYDYRIVRVTSQASSFGLALFSKVLCTLCATFCTQSISYYVPYEWTDVLILNLALCLIVLRISLKIAIIADFTGWIILDS
jgi:hypothetical protein